MALQARRLGGPILFEVGFVLLVRQTAMTESIDLYCHVSMLNSLLQHVSHNAPMSKHMILC